MRLCSSCLDQFLGRGKPRFTLVDDDDDYFNPALCGSCETNLEAVGRFDSCFVTVFRRGEERRDYYASLCPSCGDQLIQELALSL